MAVITDIDELALAVKDERIATLEAEAVALREALRNADYGTDADIDRLLSQPFDLAAFQERTTREWLTEERLAEVINRTMGGQRREFFAAKDLAAAIFHALRGGVTWPE